MRLHFSRIVVYLLLSVPISSTECQSASSFSFLYFTKSSCVSVFYRERFDFHGFNLTYSRLYFLDWLYVEVLVEINRSGKGQAKEGKRCVGEFLRTLFSIVFLYLIFVRIDFFLEKNFEFWYAKLNNDGVFISNLS